MHKSARQFIIHPGSAGIQASGAALLTFLCLLVPSPLLAAQRVPLTITEDVGVARQPGCVTTGVPFPMGALKTNESVRLSDAQGRGVPLQYRTSATWRDGSVKWLLLDFQRALGAREASNLTLESGAGVSPVDPTSGVSLEESPEAVAVNTGKLRFGISKKHFGVLERCSLDKNSNGAFEPDEVISVEGLRPAIKLAREFENAEVKAEAPDQVVIEEPGPLRAVVKAEGWMHAASTNRLLRYVVRVHAFAGSPAVQVDFTVTQMSDLKMLWVKELALALKPNIPGTLQVGLGGQPGSHNGTVASGDFIQLAQLRESSYTVSNQSGKMAAGFKAPGWVDVHGAGQGIVAGSRFFWQQFPKSLTVTRDEICFGLYPEEAPKPLDMDQGLAKTHELYFEFHEGQLTPEQCREKIAAWEHPLFAMAPTSWYCDSKVFGDLYPFDFDLFPDYETLTEASGDQFIKKMATGFRHWGDFYYGGEYKGTNSYMNLEYDVHHNFYCQFARTGLRKYLDAAITMAKHQADIDTNHKTGWQWKHSPRHVEIQAEFGHTFTRGLLETWFLTGNHRCLDAAIELGDYFTKQIRVPRELGNERQIGWSLISLLPVFEATWDKKYFEAAKETIERLLAGMDEKGKFRIRWDNRISFFNGIAATGFIYYYRATGDERVAEAAMKVIRRARGFYPEYAGRTLEAIAWAYQRTRDPEDLDFLQRTWETTMARQINWNVMELGAPTIFTVHALPFLAKGGLFPKTERPLDLAPAQFASENGFFVHHLPAGEADIYFHSQANEPFDLVIIRKGAWKVEGAAVLYGPFNNVIATLEYPKELAVWQRKVLPRSVVGRGTYHLALRSTTISSRKGGSYVTWDVATSRPMPSVFSTGANQGLEFVTPYLFTMPEPGASEIKLELLGEGEGFKKAIICDPDGNVAGSMEAFIDLGDKGRYDYTVRADVPAHQRNGIWSISLQEVSAQKIQGVVPCFSTSRGSFFRLGTK